MHALHHEHPSDLYGAPIWVSIAGFAFTFGLLAVVRSGRRDCGLPQALNNSGQFLIVGTGGGAGVTANSCRELPGD